MQTFLLVLLSIISLAYVLKTQDYTGHQYEPYAFMMSNDHWDTPERQLPGIVLEHGHSNGYVCIQDPNHPMYGREYWERDDDGNTLPTPIDYLQVHGGVTLTDKDRFRNGWIIGFDTMHYQDNSLEHDYFYVLKEINSLLRQVKDYKAEN